MPIAAVPEYLGSDFSSASPALRFGMYLKLWGIDSRSKQKSKQNLWTTHDVNYRKTGRNHEERRFEGENKMSALDAATPLSEIDLKSIAAHVQRQRAIFDAVAGEDRLELIAKSVAPFTTGLGNEHPLENGFAFLNPYGLPYLPGSGVKGVVRRAAQELASGDWEDDSGWNNVEEYAIKLKDESPVTLPLSMIDVLFGREPSSGNPDHVRGVLSFWDAIPQIKGNRLAVEIMTPHQVHYYQKDESPHDSGQPNPIHFLTVPPGSQFTFHVTCNRNHLERLAPQLLKDECWKALLKAAFRHAFEWLGFGAKTAVGYGAMERDLEKEKQLHEEQQKQLKEQSAAQKEKQRRAEMTPLERSIQEYLDGRTDKQQPEIGAVIRAVQEDRWEGEEKRAVAQWLKRKMQDAKQWRESSKKKRPEKDKNYQNTRLVKQWLADG